MSVPFRVTAMLAVLFVCGAALSVPLGTGAVAENAALNGTWRGTSPSWTIELKVNGTSWTGTITCLVSQTQWRIAGKISPDGKIDEWIGDGSRLTSLVRRRLEGTLPNIAMGGGGTCGAGSFVLDKVAGAT